MTALSLALVAAWLWFCLVTFDRARLRAAVLLPFFVPALLLARSLKWIADLIEQTIEIISAAAIKLAAWANRTPGPSTPESDSDDDTWIDDDDAWCDRCHGDGRDPWNDYLLPCPACQGEQH